MDFSKDTVHEDIRQAVRDLCAKFPDEYWMKHDQSQEFPWEFYNAIVEAGWLGLTVPTEYGGGGLGVTEAAIVEQEIAASGAGMNGCSAVHIGIFGFEPIIKYGSEDLKQRFLPRLVSGPARDRKSTRLNSSHVKISYAVFCLKKKNEPYHHADPRSTPITT